MITDSPPEPAPAGEQPAAPTPAAATPEPAPVGASCAKCSSPLAPGQDWCLQCGAGAPGSLGTPGWRSAATILGVVAVLMLGAAAAAFAALSRGTSKAPVLTTTVAAAPAPPVTTPPAATTTPTTVVPPVTAKPPKIPLTTTTPKPAATTTTPATTTPASTTPAAGEGSGEAGKPTAILLDTNAAETYNPYKYPPSSFGDPSLAIDGEVSTAWTAQLDPATAPRMAEGLLINLKTPQKVASLQLVTSTPGMTVQVYGDHGSVVPTSITDPAWVRLTHAFVVKKRHMHIVLKESKHSFTLLTLWISRAPASSVGTPTAPGQVGVSELELFPG